MKRLKLSLALLLIAALAAGGLIAQTAPAPPIPSQAQTPITVIAQDLANTMQYIASIQNTAAINTYNQDVAFYTATYGTNPNASAPAPPALPTLVKVNRFPPPSLN